MLPLLFIDDSLLSAGVSGGTSLRSSSPGRVLPTAAAEVARAWLSGLQMRLRLESSDEVPEARPHFVPGGI